MLGQTKRDKREYQGKHYPLFIRARFRSWDLWVMGPPRFRCATLIYLRDYRNKIYLIIFSVVLDAGFSLWFFRESYTLIPSVKLKILPLCLD